MNRFRVPPLPESPPPAPEPDPLLEQFRQETIKGKKTRGRPRKPEASDADSSFLDSMLPDIDSTDDSGDCSIDFNCDT